MVIRIFGYIDLWIYEYLRIYGYMKTLEFLRTLIYGYMYIYGYWSMDMDGNINIWEHWIYLYVWLLEHGYRDIWTYGIMVIWIYGNMGI